MLSSIVHSPSSSLPRNYTEEKSVCGIKKAEGGDVWIINNVFNKIGHEKRPHILTNILC
jgi:hypothetical protein